MKRQGAILVTSLGIVVILAILGSSFLLRAIHETQLSRQSSSQHHALSLAEASVDTAIQNLRVGQTDDLLSTSLSGGSFWAEVDPAGGALQYQITGHGLYEAQQRNVEAVVQLSPLSVFQFALFGSTGATISGDVITDSFDSTLGSYSAQTSGTDGDVGSNCTSSGCMTLSGGIAINGQVAVGPDLSNPASAVTISGTVLITANPPIVSQSASFPMPAVAVPAGLTCTDESVGGQQTLTLSSAVGAYCFTNLSVGGGGTIAVDGPVTVYVTGQFSAGGNTTMGSSTDPKNLLLVLTSPQTGSLGSLSGTTVFSGAIYAPNGAINVSGDAQVYGSIMANSVTVSGNARVHYDTSLTQVTTIPGPYAVRMQSWREL
jgi:hypothetical protein